MEKVEQGQGYLVAPFLLLISISGLQSQRDELQEKSIFESWIPEELVNILQGLINVQRVYFLHVLLHK